MDRSYADIEAALITLLRQLLAELGVRHQRRMMTLDARLDRDLGIDSLSKVEFFHRIEKHFDISLPEALLAEADTLGDFVIAVQKVKPTARSAARDFVPQLVATHIDPSKAKTLVDVLYLYGEQAPDRIHIYLRVEQGIEQPITYGQLLTHAQAIASGLTKMGIQRGETVAVMLPTCEGYFYAFFGILLAGAIPVSIYPPFRPDQVREYALRESVILRNAEVRMLITFHKAEALGKLLRVLIPSLKAAVTVDQVMAQGDKISRIHLDEDDAAIVQYTSGSTAAPKGVLLSHRNLLSNIRLCGEVMQVQPSDVCVSWLPLYHDMGLIGAWLGSFYHGIPVAIMSPLAFLTRPQRWLWAIHYHRATLSAGPNFAYELCVKKIAKKDIEGLDLSSWRLAFNGAEAINPQTLVRFTRAFKPYGFSPTSQYPVYGLAECALALCFPKLGHEPWVDKIERLAFEQDRKAQPVTKKNVPELAFVSCGKPLPEHEIRIVDDQGHVLGERCVGNLEFKGPSAMQGYFHNPQATAAVCHQGWLATGDLAYLAKGEVFICGRKKDVIIKAGRNLYPEEVEDVVGSVDGVRKGCVAVFGVMDKTRATEKLIIVAETKYQDTQDKLKINATIIEQITTVLGMPPDQVLLVPAHTIPKTSSGKLRRSDCKMQYIKGTIKKPAVPMWLQLTRLTLRGLLQKSLSLLAACAKIAYNSYFLGVCSVLSMPFVLSIFMTPRPLARKIARAWMRTMFILALCPLRLEGKEHLQPGTPVVYVANHASYVDVAVLIAMLPPNMALIGKKELRRVPVLSALMRKLGAVLIERFDFSKSMEDTQKIATVLQHNEAIAIFPEGTFTYATGLRPFRLGAFKVAVETNSLICPVALRGTRSILRGESVLLKPGRIVVHISPCIRPTAKGWDEMIRLSKQVREEIAKHCGEQILNL